MIIVIEWAKNLQHFLEYRGHPNSGHLSVLYLNAKLDIST